MNTAGHVSRAMLSRYSHVRMEAKRRALDEIVERQRAGDEKRKEEAEQHEEGWWSLSRRLFRVVRPPRLLAPLKAPARCAPRSTLCYLLTATSTSPKPRSAASSVTLT